MVLGQYIVLGKILELQDVALVSNLFNHFISKFYMKKTIYKIWIPVEFFILARV
jgi:hypothetical protein